MASHRTFPPLMLAIAVFMTTVSLSRNAEGASVQILDIDSLVYDAADVVEAHILGPRPDQPYWVGDDVRITAVYQGNMKPGDIEIVSGLSDYQKVWDTSGRANLGLGTGDDVVLFLEPDVNPALRHYAKKVFGPLSSGVRWIEGNKVLSFAQMNNPGPMVADTANPFSRTAPPSLEEFRASLKVKVADMARIHQHLMAPPDVLEVPWLLQAIGDRSTAHPGRHIEDDALLALADCISHFRDPELAYQALCVNPWIPVGLGFATPKGREFLLAKLAATDTSEQMRAAVMGVIGRAGVNYQWTADARTRPSQQSLAPPFAPRNASYITRVVRAAILNANQVDVWTTFLTMSRGWLLPLDWVKNPEYRGDVADAVSVLDGFYRTTATEQQQFDIERLLAFLGRAAYETLGNQKSPFDAIAAYDSRYIGQRPPLPCVLVTYQYFRLPWIEEHRNDPTMAQSLVRSLATGTEFVIDPNPAPAFMQNFQGEGAFANGPRPLPKGLPAGRYRVFLRFFHDDRVVGESHGFEVDQNGTPVAPTTRP